MKDNLFALRKTCAGLLILCISSSTLFAQGKLTPPLGPPTETMKSLDQIDTHIAQVGEARIPIDAAHTPGNDIDEFAIDKPGSYYLIANANITHFTGIRVRAPGVTLDLNGFQLKGGAASNGAGIVVEGVDCTVKNGSISGFDTGVFGSPDGGIIAHLIVSGSKTSGITANSNWQITDCLSRDNGLGFIVGSNCTLKQCSAYYNRGTGIFIQTNSIATHCTAFSNQGEGISATDHCGLFQCSASYNKSASSSSFGINVGHGSTVIDCMAALNATTNATPGASKGGGIRAGTGSTVKDCTTEGNAGDGIQALSSCTVSGCTSTNNGVGTTGSGIATDIRAAISGCTAIGNKADGIVFSGDSFVLNNHASLNGGAGFHDIGSASRIDGNVSRENIGLGIFAATIDTVVRNNSVANGNSAPNNQYGPTVGPNWGPTGATANTSTSPWANF